MPSDSDTDALFELPLAEFIAARNALATALKKAGRAQEAAQVKAMAKPSATAWAVNQLFWRHGDELERLVAIGEQVREASGSATEVRVLLDERRAVVSALTDRGAAILREAGHAASPDATRRMTINLETLSSRGRADAEPRAGRLTVDLEPLGFDDLAALLAGVKLEPAKVLQFDRRPQEREKKAAQAAAAARDRERERAKRAVQAAEQALHAAQQHAQRADAAVANANAHAEALERQRRELEARLNQAQDGVRASSKEAKDAAQAVLGAARALEQARAAVVPD